MIGVEEMDFEEAVRVVERAKTVLIQGISTTQVGMELTDSENDLVKITAENEIEYKFTLKEVLKGLQNYAYERMKE